MFRAVQYRRADPLHGAKRVIVDRGDGFPDAMTEADLRSAINTVRSQRRRYRDQREFDAALRVYEGALEVMKQ